MCIPKRLAFFRKLPLLLIFCAVLSCQTLATASQPQVSKVEPPNWWTGFVSPVMVLLYGDNLEDAKISVSYPGVKIEKIQLQSDGKHAFVWLNIAKTAKPGTVTLTVKTSVGFHDRIIAVVAATSSGWTVPGRYTRRRDLPHHARSLRRR